MKHLVPSVKAALFSLLLSPLFLYQLTAAHPLKHDPEKRSPLFVVVSARNQGIITCKYTSVRLFATASESEAVYAWTGPDGFTSSQQNPLVSVPGTYIVVSMTCIDTATASIVVTENKAAPAFTAQGGSLACGNPITVSSQVPTTVYNWTGPNKFTSTSSTPIVTRSGTYTVTVTDTTNGCAAMQSVEVISGATNFWTEDFSQPDGTIADSDATSWSTQNSTAARFAVYNHEFRVNNITVNGEGRWLSGNINIAGKTNVIISIDVRSGVSGNGALDNDSTEHYDYIRLYYKLDNGAEVLFKERRGTINGNAGFLTFSSPELTGNSLQIIIKARATATDEFYYFDNIKVSGVTKTFIDATAFVSGMLTCNYREASLTGSSSNNNVSYNWSGPGGFVAATPLAFANTAGHYMLTVTSNISACSTVLTVEVQQDIAPPAAITAINSGPVSCYVTESTITASTTSTNVEYAWLGPDGYLAFQPVETVTTPGDYQLIVTNISNGCSRSVTTTVAFDFSDCERRVQSNQQAVAATTPAIAASIQQFKYSVYPNPLQANSILEFATPEKASIQVTLYNSMGVAVKTIFNQAVAAQQTCKVPLQTASLTAGTYYCIFKVNEKVYTNKLLLIR